MKDLIENHFRENYRNLLKKTMFKTFQNEQDAEDIVQEAFTRAWQYRASYDPSKPFTTWFNTILANAYKDWKIEKYQHPDMEELDEEMVELIPEEPCPKERIKDIHAIINKFYSGDQQEILRLYYVQGLVARGVCQVLNLSQAHVEHVIRYFKDELKRMKV